MISIAYTGSIREAEQSEVERNEVEQTNPGQAGAELTADYLSEGKRLLRAGNTDASIEVMRRAINAGAGGFWIYHLLGCALEKKGEVDNAISNWTKALEVIYLESGGVASGESDSVNKNLFWAYTKLAFALDQKGDQDASIKFAEQALSIIPDSPEMLLLLKRQNSVSDKEQTEDAFLFFPIQKTRAEKDSIVIHHRKSPKDSDGIVAPTRFPAPPEHLMHYGESVESHLNGGQLAVSQMLAALEKANVQIENSQRILEFGCSNGRLLRWLSPLAKDRQIWGVDIESDKVFWAIENLSPTFNFAVNTTVPHLPFKSGHFDFIFAGSIFTHIGEQHIGWLLELKRILAPGGHIYLTFHDEHTIDYFLENPDKYQGLRNILMGPYEDNPHFYDEQDFYAKQNQVVMHSRYIKKLTDRILQIVSVSPRAYAGLQTGYLFTHL